MGNVVLNRMEDMGNVVLNRMEDMGNVVLNRMGEGKFKEFILAMKCLCLLVHRPPTLCQIPPLPCAGY